MKHPELAELPGFTRSDINRIQQVFAGDRMPVAPKLVTASGMLFNADCLKVLPAIRSESADVIFADPPFNLGKNYSNGVSDDLADAEYLAWSQTWLTECIRTLKPGGALFLYNLPKWNIHLGAFIANQGLLFRHWIAVSIKLCLPIPGRLYPAHYSLLYFTKGKPAVFRNIRTPILTCRHCGKEIRDYGGHRDAMNPLGVNLTDVWDDIPPVRHWKFKSKKRRANQISTKLVARAIEISSLPGDLVIDPFGGSGTTYDVCEQIGRRWIGIELGDCDVIVERLSERPLSPHSNGDYVQQEDAKNR